MVAMGLLFTSSICALEVNSEVGVVVRNMVAKSVFFQNYLISFTKMCRNQHSKIQKDHSVQLLENMKEPGKEFHLSCSSYIKFHFLKKKPKWVYTRFCLYLSASQPLQPMVSNGERCSSLVGSPCIAFSTYLRTLLLSHGSNF